MVGRQSPPCERAPHSELPTTSSNSIGCLQFRVRSSKQWGRHQGEMDTGRSQSSYQLQGTVGSIICRESLHKKSSKCPCLDSDDNTTTIAYVNKMGGAKRCLLDHYARHLWSWRLKRRITLRAKHIKGCLNTIADRESRAKLDTSDWHLNQNFFQTLMNRLGQCTIDLFAGRTNHQLPRFFSYKPDPEAEAIDALAQPWAIEIGYAFPPFTLIAKCLRKVIHEKATITLVCPVWPTQPWYVQLLQLVVDTPILLPIIPGLLTSPQGQEHPLVSNKTLVLAGWGVSGEIFLQKAYQDKLQALSSLPREVQLRSVQVMLVKMGGLV